jgi:hypothetical protein
MGADFSANDLAGWTSTFSFQAYFKGPSVAHTAISRKILTKNRKRLTQSAGGAPDSAV